MQVAIDKLSNSDTEKTAATAYGEYLGLQLAKLDDKMLHIVMKLCNDALFLALTNELKSTATINNE